MPAGGRTTAGKARQRDRNAVTRSHRRIGRLAEHMAGATGCEQRRLRADGYLMAVRAVDESRADATPVFDDERNHASVIPDLDIRERRHAVPQRSADLTSGGIARVQHAPPAVSRLETKRE